MSRRALLLGSATYGLVGIDADVASMEELLRSRGFDDVATARGEDATRDGMRAALDRLCAQTEPGDAVVLYYSGHGSRLVRPDAAGRREHGLEPYVQFLVPTDVDRTTASEFHGLLGAELTAATRRLTATTGNVTVLLDCCHAGAMVRSLDMVPKSVQPALPVDAGAELADRLAAERRRDGWETNPLAVRVAACETDRSAYEVPRLDGPGRAGLFTGVLVATLREVGDRRVSWHSVLARVRDQVQAVVQQRPDVEGPSGRVPFGLEELPQHEVLPVRRFVRSVVVEGAVLLGLAPGDLVEVRREDDDAVLAQTAVRALDGADAVLDLAPEQLERGVGLVAVPRRTGVRRSVTVDVGGRVGELLHAALDASPRLVPGLEGALATVTTDGDGGGLVVVDGTGARARSGVAPADDTGVGATVALLEQLAAGDRLRSLPSGEGAAALDGDVVMELHRWAGDEADASRVALGTGEVRLHRGDRIGITVRNLGASPAYVWVLDVGVSGRIALVSDDLPSGRPLAPSGQPGDAHTFGDPGGLPLGWPDDVPADAPRPETLVLIAADRPADLRALTTAGRDARSGDDLPTVLAQVGSGVRDLGGIRGDALRYLVRRSDVLLVPTPRPPDDEPAFEVDDSPDLTARLLVPRGVDVPGRVAVQLSELVVRRNRALFGADVRLDWLAVTAGPDDAPVPVVGTDRFPRVSDGDALPIDGMLLFHGEVRDYLELRLWVGRDDRKGQDLSELFAARLGDAGVQAALATVVGLAVAAPPAAVAVGAVAAVAVLTKVVGELVATATGKDIGVYRTGLLAKDRFGEGRIPSTGRRQAVDVELALEVVVVD